MRKLELVSPEAFCEELEQKESLVRRQRQGWRILGGRGTKVF